MGQFVSSEEVFLEDFLATVQGIRLGGKGREDKHSVETRNHSLTRKLL